MNLSTRRGGCAGSGHIVYALPEDVGVMVLLLNACLEINDNGHVGEYSLWPAIKII